jgi:hypothetical protein
MEQVECMLTVRELGKHDRVGRGCAEVSDETPGRVDSGERVFCSVGDEERGTSSAG